MANVRLGLLAVVASCLARAAAESTCSEEVKKLKRELEEARAACQASPLSVAGAAAGVVSDILDKTTVDEQLAGYVSDGFGKAKGLGRGMADRVMSVDYAGYVKDLKANELYQTHLQKHVAPVFDYVGPALETASVHVGPALETAKSASQAALNTVSEHAPKHLEAATSRAGGLLDSIFGALARVFPKYKSSLPTNSVDRIIFLFLGAFLIYNLFKASLLLFRLNIKIAFVLLRIARKLFYLVVMLPLKIFRFVFWVGTGFYCCGLCARRRSQAAKDSTVAGSQVTVEDVKKLLDNAKKEKKLEAAVKQLQTLAKSGRAMTGPKGMEGKTVSKAVLSQAVAKFKEIDAKKFNL